MSPNPQWVYAPASEHLSGVFTGVLSLPDESTLAARPADGKTITNGSWQRLAFCLLLALICCDVPGLVSYASVHLTDFACRTVL